MQKPKQSPKATSSCEVTIESTNEAATITSNATTSTSE
jgi:hypothetical protein